jgi:hypothetical protein
VVAGVAGEMTNSQIPNDQGKRCFGRISVVICICYLVIVSFSHAAEITVSKETTVITEPLAEDGLPDFEAYKLKKGFEGITPENNAAVLLWQVFWPEGVDPEYREPMRKALGLLPEVETAPKLVTPYDETVREAVADWLVTYYRKTGQSEEPAASLRERVLSGKLVDDVIDQTQHRPWTSDQIPPIAHWLKENQAQLDLIVEASKRPRLYSPSPNYFDKKQESLLNALLPLTQDLRHAARALSTRAMWHVGEGRVDQAWNDILTGYRIGLLLRDDDYIVGRLVSVALQGVMKSAGIMVLHYGSFDTAQAHDMVCQLQKMPRGISVATAIDLSEKLMFVDATLAMATERDSHLERLGKGLTTGTDWNTVLKDGVAFYDQIRIAASIEDRKMRYQEAERLTLELENRINEAKRFESKLWTALSPRTRTRQCTTIMLAYLVPEIRGMLSAADRCDANYDMFVTAAALAEYRAVEGDYPDTLDKLVPNILKTLPIDLYSDKPFVYHRKGDGYVLYSVFENGVDDNGTDYGGGIISGEWAKEPQDASREGHPDLVLRVPVPPFEIPPLPARE